MTGVIITIVSFVIVAGMVVAAIAVLGIVNYIDPELLSSPKTSEHPKPDRGKEQWGPTYQDPGQKPNDKYEKHHIIMDVVGEKTAEEPGRPKYSRNLAPIIWLQGPNIFGSPHYKATQYQLRTRGGGTYSSEREISDGALVAAGVSLAERLSALARADLYFLSYLGWNPNKVTYIPKTRP